MKSSMNTKSVVSEDRPITSLEELFNMWGLDSLLRRYHSRNLGIENLYPWQAQCLEKPGIVDGTRDLLYSAPTSGGKTMVAELLLLLRVVGALSLPRSGRNSSDGGVHVPRRTIFVLPFISMVTEKVKHLQRVVAPYNRGRPKKQRIKVRAFYGSKGGGGLRGTHVAICTIEKANALVNKMAEADELHSLSCLVLDELHMIGDGIRGQTLELLLTKVLRANRIATDSQNGEGGKLESGPAAGTHSRARDVSSALPLASSATAQACPLPKPESTSSQSTEPAVSSGREGVIAKSRTQVIGMSATLSNSEELAGWLGAALYISDYRPVPLDERVVLGMKVYDKEGNDIRTFDKPAHRDSDPDHVVTLCRESCRAGDQVIVFCPTKQFCHNCALKVARNLNVPVPKSVAAKRSALLDQLAKEMSIGVDPIFQETVPYGVAFHHAGLVESERSTIEKAFREGTLGVLVATSTLGAGVNLPAGRVLLRNLNAPGGGLSATSYRQMAGRAGRKGAGRARGEALIMAGNKGEAVRAAALINSGLADVKSALAPANDGGAGLTRLVLEAMCGKFICTKSELAEYVACTLLWCQQSDEDARQSLLDYAWAALHFLQKEDCVRVESALGKTPRAPISRCSNPRRFAAGTTSAVTTTVSPYSLPPSVAIDKAREKMLKEALVKSETVNRKRSPVGASDSGRSECDINVSSTTAVSGRSESRSKDALEAMSTLRGCRGSDGGATLGSCNTTNNAIAKSSERAGGEYPLVNKGAVYSRVLSAYFSVRSPASRIAGVRAINLSSCSLKIAPTKLGLAIFRSSMMPGDGLVVYRDLSDAAKGVNLRNTLHLAYLLTPLCPLAGLKPNWEWLRSIHSKASASAAETPPGPGADLVAVFDRVGITEAHLHAWSMVGPRGGFANHTPVLSPEVVEEAAKLRRGAEQKRDPTTGAAPALTRREGRSSTISSGEAARNAVRLVAAMALTDVSGGASPGQVAKSYGMNKGDLQSLRRSAAVFSAMITSFLKELGWTLLLMLVKGHIPKLSLGVSNHLLPLMQVSGMSRAEASALYQGGILNTKNLVAASTSAVATALRINTPFRSRPGGLKDQGAGDCIRFERRAHMLKESARSIIARREKGRKAQTAKLLRVVQKRLSGEDSGAVIGAKDSSIGIGGGEHDFIKAAPKGSTKRPRAENDRHGRLGGPGGSMIFREDTGLSDEDRGSRDEEGSDGSSGSGDDSAEEEDELDMAVAALMSGRVQEDTDCSDDDATEARLASDEGVKLAVSPVSRDASADICGLETEADPLLHLRSDVSLGLEAPKKVEQPSSKRSSPASGSDPLLPEGQVVLSARGSTMKNASHSVAPEVTSVRGGSGCEAAKPRSIVFRGLLRLPQKVAESKERLGASSGVRKHEKAIYDRHDCTGVGGGRSRNGGGGYEVSSSSSLEAGVLMTPVDSAPPCPSSSSRREVTRGTLTTSAGRTLRTPVRTPPSSGSASFLYEAETSPHVLKAIPEGGNGEPVPDMVDGVVGCPAFEACTRSTAKHESVIPGGDVFARGPRAMARLSTSWRTSQCFAFVLGSRAVCPVTVWTGSLVGDGRGRTSVDIKGNRGNWSGSAYRRSWEALVSMCPVAPYTVESAGESFVPLSRRESERGMQVVSGVAISLDGRTSHYIPLPPVLPPRPSEWQCPTSSSDGEEDGRSSLEQQNGGAESKPRVGEKPIVSSVERDLDARCSYPRGEARLGGRLACWDALPGRGVERVVTFLGFPWLCAGWSSEMHHKRRRQTKSSGGRDSGSQRRFKCWNQALLVCRRWNALGVEALNRLTAEEPSGRWGLLRNVMENSTSTKVCFDMKGALACLRGLGVRVRGPLEDPAVATWLAEPPLDDGAYEYIANSASALSKSRKRKKSSTLTSPRPSVTSLHLQRQPGTFVDLWCMQAAATLSFMADKERVLRDLSLSLPFHLIEMPAVAAAASMEYCGLSVKPSRLLNMRREVEQRLRDLRGLADQLVEGSGDHEGDATEKKSTVLASSKRVHDMIYLTLGVSPPTSWKKRIGPAAPASGIEEGSYGDSSSGSGSRRGASKRADLGPTDTASLQEILASSGTTGPPEDPHGFIRAVIQHRMLGPASHSLGRLLRANRWHAHLGGARVNPRIELFTTTGRMVTSDPPLQNLGHCIQLTRSWRLNLAEEMEADLPDVQDLPRIWADERSGDSTDGSLGEKRNLGRDPSLSQGTTDEDARNSLKVILVNSGNPESMNTGEIMAIVEDRRVCDRLFEYTADRRPQDRTNKALGSSAGGSVKGTREGIAGVMPVCLDDDSSSDLRKVTSDGDAVVAERDPSLVRNSMASFWRDRGFPYAPSDAARISQVLVRLGSSTRGGIYSYPADKVFRVGASFLSDAKVTSLVARDAGNRNPWFGKETLLKPRDTVVASPGYVFVSADYSQVEMRLMAHLSGDVDLINVFLGGGDVFRLVSAALQGGGKKAENVTDEERRKAKITVYGILYGQSAAALGQQLGEKTGAAWKIREMVLRTYPRLRDYMERVKDDCKQCGYVETLLGRRRYLPQINSPDDQERARAERQAVNTVCQGSAADLLKLAATNIAARLERCAWMRRCPASRAASIASEASESSTASATREHPSCKSPCRFPQDNEWSDITRRPACRLVLAIHDELLYEVRESHASEVVHIVTACMEGAVSLAVPLVAHPRSGRTWGSMSASFGSSSLQANTQ